MEGFNCLGAEETTKDKALAMVKSEGPGLISKIIDAASGKKTDTAPTPDQMAAKAGKGKNGSALTTPMKIGIGVGAGLVALTGGLLLWKLT